MPSSLDCDRAGLTEPNSLAPRLTTAPGEASVVPASLNTVAADLDGLFAGYDGSYRPEEDGFAAPAGGEAL